MAFFQVPPSLGNQLDDDRVLRTYLRRTLPPDVLERATEACRRTVDVDGTYTGVTTDVLPSWDIATYENCRTEPSP